MSYEDDIAAAKTSGRKYRTEIDVRSGQRRVLYLTPDEVQALDAERIVQEAQQRAERARELRAGALAALDDQRLALASSDPNAPTAVREFVDYMGKAEPAASLLLK